jgi:oxygen-independent coproporphyrinogen-3 oxidase
VDFDHFRQRCGVDMDTVYGKTLAMLQRDGLLTRTTEAVFLTPRGRMLGNRVFEHFI